MAGQLTISEYNRLELDGYAESPNFVIGAFQPVLFNEVGYPTKIYRESEMWKYVDVNSELRFEENFDTLLGGITPEEFDLLKTQTLKTAAFTQEHLGRKIISRGNVLSGLNIFRHIKYIFGDVKTRIFEIGPGSGNIGGLSFLQGYPHTSTDVAQALYLYQNRFWNHLTDGSVRELALADDGDNDWSAPEGGQMVHGPWWKFAQIDPDSTPRYDVMTCNDVLREMHEFSLGFTLRTASNLLTAEDTPKAVVFRGWGGGFLPSDGYVAEFFYQLGFVLVHHDHWISVLTREGTPFAANHLQLPCAENKLKSFASRSMRRLAGAAGRPPFRGFEPTPFSSDKNPISRSIMEGREAQINARTVGREEVVEFYRELLGRDELMSPDEKFVTLARIDRSTKSTALQ